MRHLFFFLVIAMFSCQKKEAEQKNPIMALQELGDLATVEYTVTKIIKASDNKSWFKWGERKILMTCEATIKAGIDLTSINKNNFKTDGKRVWLTLPPPKVISFSIPPEKITTAYEEVGTLRDPFTSKERDALLAQGERQIRNSIESLGIFEQAKANTATLTYNLLRQLGYEEINIRQSGEKFQTVTP